MLFNNLPFTCLNSIKLNHLVFENKNRYNIENKSLLVQFLSNLYEIQTSRWNDSKNQNKYKS